MPTYLVIARAESPWRSTVSQQAKRQAVRVTRDTMDCRVPRLRSLLAMTNSVEPSRTLSHSCHREGVSPWRSTGAQKANRYLFILPLITRLTIRLNIWCNYLVSLIFVMKKLPVLLAFLYTSVFLWSAQPVPYSGKVAINGINFDGEAQFTFSLQDKDGKTLWRNGASKDDSIKVNIRNGYYTVLLGGQGMNALPPQLFLDNDELYVKVRFDNGDGKGLRHLAPDQRITATPRALVAEVAKNAKTADTAQIAQTANSVKPGGVTASQIKNNTITTAQLNGQILKYLKPEITVAPQAPGLVFHGQTVTLLSRAEGKYLQ
ncbi:hypothetical protein N9N13_00490, partial [Opitutales bacterium]|nr:hypothetical protein [Opitutales bacterium]